MGADGNGRTILDAQIQSLRGLFGVPKTSVDIYWGQIRTTLTAIYEAFNNWASGIGSRAELPNATIVEETNRALDDLLPELKKLERWLERNAGGNIRWSKFSENIRKAREDVSRNEYSKALFIFLQWIRVYESQRSDREQWLIKHEDDQNRRFIVATAIETFADNLEQAVWIAEDSNDVPPQRPRRTPTA